MTDGAVPTATTFSWDGFGRYSQAGAVPDGYPLNLRTLYSPRDPGVHAAIVDLLRSARHSIVANHYGYDDDEADGVIRSKMLDEHVYVQMSLDKTQAGGAHEKELLAKWPADAIGTSLAIGQSAKHAISHLKMTIVDGLYVVTGSTNWSMSGEQKQDNQLTFIRDAVVAAEARSVLDVNHSEMLRQMKGA
jgi:phosphatidylserine/phosphatidylglycerophosphate/cardiolipin synthase-like enzyme